MGLPGNQLVSVVMDGVPAPQPLELTVVVPTMNERENIEPLLAGLQAALAGVAWEVVFVDDDSTDGTAELIRRLGRDDRRVRCVQRVGRRGLSSACVEGVLSCSAPFVAVMDADLQHDESLLPRMLEALRPGDLDVVIGSRYASGGTTAGWDRNREAISRFATWLSGAVVRAKLTDPMSGFFMFRRDAFEPAMRRLSQHGFKMLVDFFASAPRPLRFRELPYAFKGRRFGESKLDALVAWQYLMLIMDKMFGRFVPVRFVLFAAVGGLGLVVHMAILTVTFKWLAIGFATAQATATMLAMLFNFVLNNVFTYRDRQLRGWGMVRGLASFMLVCGIGAVANVGVGNFVFRADYVWWLAGVAGVAVGAVWNYAASSVFTWSGSKPR